MRTRFNRWSTPIGAALAASAITVIVWFGWTSLIRNDPNEQIIATVKVGSALLMDFYPTIDELSGEADIIIVGTVGEIAQKGLDRGRDGTGGPIPYVVYSVAVQEAFKGDPSDQIYVFRRTADTFPGQVLTELEKGENVLLYLLERSSVYAPTVTVSDVLYIPISFDNGVFDISASGAAGPVGIVDDNAIASPRGIGHNMFAAGTTFKLSEVRAAIESGTDGAIGPSGNVND